MLLEATRLKLLSSARLRLGTRASPSAIPSLRSALTSFGGYLYVSALAILVVSAAAFGLGARPRSTFPALSRSSASIRGTLRCRLATRLIAASLVS